MSPSRLDRGSPRVLAERPGALNVGHHEHGHGGNFQVYTRVFAGRFFVEIVARAAGAEIGVEIRGDPHAHPQAQRLAG